MIPLRVPGSVTVSPISTYALFVINVWFWAILQGHGSDPDFAKSICKYALHPGLLWNHVDAINLLHCTDNHVTPDSRLVTVGTSMFLHGGWLHLIGNMWYLLVLAPRMEDRLGSSVVFLMFYFASGIGAAAAQIAFDPTSSVPLLGASGAIAGLLGAYAVLLPRARILMLIPIHFIPVPVRLPALVMTVAWLFLQVAGSILELFGRSGEIAYGAHVGGFATGVTLSLIYVCYEKLHPAPPPHESEPATCHSPSIDSGAADSVVAAMTVNQHQTANNTKRIETTSTDIPNIDGDDAFLEDRSKRRAASRPSNMFRADGRSPGSRFTDEVNDC